MTDSLTPATLAAMTDEKIRETIAAMEPKRRHHEVRRIVDALHTARRSAELDTATALNAADRWSDTLAELSAAKTSAPRWEPTADDRAAMTFYVGKLLTARADGIEPPAQPAGIPESVAEKLDAIVSATIAKIDKVGTAGKRVDIGGTLADIVAAGHLTIGQTLTVSRHGETVSGSVGPDGTIIVRGESHANPSAAARAALVVLGASGKAANGWREWTTADGTPIGAFRNQ